MSGYQEDEQCDCCGYKTITDKDNSYDLCYLCDWENDTNYTWERPDEVVGGANQDYSLREANQNFKKYYIMYRVSEPERYFEIFNEVIEAKQKVMTLLNLIDILEERKESTVSELTHLMFAVGEMRYKIKSNPYRVHTFTGQIQKKI